MQSALPIVGLVSVNVAEPEIIGTHRGKPVSSAIRKRPAVASGTIVLTTTNLAGDRQGDLRVHGGPDKAVYAYPTEHLPLWNAELEEPDGLGPAAFGENLSTVGVLEADVRV